MTPDLDGAEPVPVLDVVARTWATALGVTQVDADTGFFELGADSVTLIGVVATLRMQWPALRLIDLFEHATVRDLAAFLASIDRHPSNPAPPG